MTPSEIQTLPPGAASGVCRGAQMPANYFAGPIADAYDDDVREMFTPAAVDPAVECLAQLAGDGRALELGIGTGRLALPLSRRGISVHGVELSEDMIARLRAKPGGGRIPVTQGDFATIQVSGSFRLAYLAFNTIMNLTSQEEQLACFRNVAVHLEPGGTFLIEVVIPDLRRLPPGETLKPFRTEPSRLGFDEYDVATQRMWSHHYRVIEGRFEAFSMPFRYVWPSELDLMAGWAGMALQDRWEDWDRRPFTSESSKHISVWTKS